MLTWVFPAYRSFAPTAPPHSQGSAAGRDESELRSSCAPVRAASIAVRRAANKPRPETHRISTRALSLSAVNHGRAVSSPCEGKRHIPDACPFRCMQRVFDTRSAVRLRPASARDPTDRSRVSNPNRCPTESPRVDPVHFEYTTTDAGLRQEAVGTTFSWKGRSRRNT